MEQNKITNSTTTEMPDTEAVAEAVSTIGSAVVRYLAYGTLMSLLLRAVVWWSNLNSRSPSPRIVIELTPSTGVAILGAIAATLLGLHFAIRERSNSLQVSSAQDQAMILVFEVGATGLATVGFIVAFESSMYASKHSESLVAAMANLALAIILALIAHDASRRLANARGALDEVWRVREAKRLRRVHERWKPDISRPMGDSLRRDASTLGLVGAVLVIVAIASGRFDVTILVIASAVPVIAWLTVLAWVWVLVSTQGSRKLEAGVIAMVALLASLAIVCLTISVLLLVPVGSAFGVVVLASVAASVSSACGAFGLSAQRHLVAWVADQLADRALPRFQAGGQLRPLPSRADRIRAFFKYWSGEGSDR